MKIWIPLISLFLLTVSLMFLTIHLFRKRWINESKLTNSLKNVSISVFTILWLFMILEIVFATFFIQSDGFGFTLASKRWAQKYWNPINSDGYRDFEQKWGGNKILFVLGDSFVAGHGIENIKDRFPSVLGKKLGSEWTVAILAHCGWNTTDEYNALVNHPKKPKRIIVSYFINDIEYAAVKNGHKVPNLIKRPNKFIAPFIKCSFVLNYFYCRVYRGNLGNIYWDYLKKAYNDPIIWKSHELELLNLINYANQVDSEIAFIVWPHLVRISESMPFTSRVVRFLKERDVKVIDLTDYFVGREPEDLIINSMDAHPNVKTHAEVAQLAYEIFFPKL